LPTPEFFGTCNDMIGKKTSPELLSGKKKYVMQIIILDKTVLYATRLPRPAPSCVWCSSWNRYVASGKHPSVPFPEAATGADSTKLRCQ